MVSQNSATFGSFEEIFAIATNVTVIVTGNKSNCIQTQLLFKKSIQYAAKINHRRVNNNAT